MVAPPIPPRTVAVFGSSRSTEDSDAYAEARAMGAAIARGGAAVACGGYAGVMEGAARGAHERGGQAFGYTLAGLAGRRANRFLTRETPCATLYERLERLVRDSDAWVALGGGIGTVAEVLVAWNEVHLEQIGARPLVVVGPLWADALAGLARLPEIGAALPDYIHHVVDVDAASRLLTDLGVLDAAGLGGSQP